jgi:site-specific recombinase XerD
MIKTEAFINYLKQQDKQSEKSIKEHLLNTQHYQQWAIEQQFTNIHLITYTELLNYIQHEKERNLKTQTIKQKLNSISKYYEYLKHIAVIDKNPTKKIKLKGELKTITQNVLSYIELEQLYNQYLKLNTISKHHQLSVYVKQKNNVLAGLLIWQGAVSSEIQKMNLEHINLEQGIVYIPKSKRGAGRELKLFPNQILEFYKYINETKQQLSKVTEPVEVKNLELKPENSPLFNGWLSPQCGTIIKQLQGINPKINNASQLRASIIIHWIKVYGKRQAQYMAGHKYISSTERFELQEIDSLTDTLLKHHPFS